MAAQGVGERIANLTATGRVSRVVPTGEGTAIPPVTQRGQGSRSALAIGCWPTSPEVNSPADPNRVKIEGANKIIATLDGQQHVFFVNINSRFLDEKGGPDWFRPSDNLHPIEQGYEIWASAVAPTLQSWVK